jgi:opacity protein-like surface antigen
MNRRLWPGTLGLVLLFLHASPALAGNLDLTHPPNYERSYQYRERSPQGFEHRTMLRVHMGISAPTGDFGDIAETGWGIGGSIGYGVGRNTVIGGGVAFHHFGNDVIDGHTNIVPITASVDYGFNTRGRIRPWISGGLGIYNVSFEDVIPGDGVVSDSESDFGFNFGFGIAGPMSSGTSWGAGLKYHHVAGDQFIDSDFFALQGGFSFPL